MQIKILIFPGPGVCFIQTEGIVGCLDPILHDWFAYVPKVKRPSTTTPGGPETLAPPSAVMSSVRTEGKLSGF